MSKRPIEQKKHARMVRAAQKKRALRKLPPLFLVVHGGNATIRRHQYLREHGLPFSEAVASAPLRPAMPREERQTGRQSYRTKGGGRNGTVERIVV